MRTPPPEESALPSPYRLQLGSGYSAFKLGKGQPRFEGPVFQASMGQDFALGRKTAIYFQGTFRYGALKNNSKQQLSYFHWGLESGFEFTLAPRILGVAIFTGLGSNVFHSPAMTVAADTTRSIHNQKSFALTLGASLSLIRGVLVLTGAWQPNFGLKVPSEPGSSAARGYNPRLAYFNAGLDLARTAAWIRRGEDFSRPAFFGEWVRGIKPGLILDSTFTYNFRRPVEGKNALRGFDNRWDRPLGNYLELSLDRAVDPAHPFGLRIDFGVGEDAAFAASVDAFSGKYHTLQQLYAALRLPIRRGLTLRGPIFATPIGAEVLEGPLNNQISRSFQFNYGIPFRHLGLLADYPFSENVTASAGLVHGWDNVFQLGNQVSPAFLGALQLMGSEKFKMSLAGTLGEDRGRLRNLVDVIATLTLNRFSLIGNYDWGHEGRGEGLKPDNWHAFSLMARYDFNKYLGCSARGEVFADPNGVRTGTPQVLGEVSSTLHVQPWKWLRLRLEYRHDQSNRASFAFRRRPSRYQDTLALGIGLVF